MGDDFYYTPPSSPPVGGPPTGGQPPSPGPAPGMPGHSWHQQEQVRAQVQADVGPAVPRTSANLIAGVAAIGAALMLVGSCGPWVKIGVFQFSESIGGLRSDVNGRYVLALGIAALLTAGTAMTQGQTSVQVRQICAGVLVALGAVGLGIVIHDWVTISDQVEKVNAFAKSFAPQISQFGGDNPDVQSFLRSFDGFEVSRGWGLWVSGIASSGTGLAGAYLFLAKS